MSLDYDLMGYKVTSLSLASILSEVFSSESISVVNTINPHSYIVAKHDTYFMNSLRSSDFLIPDGSGIVFSIQYLYGEKLNKIAGYDLFSYTLSLLNNKYGKVFFLGSTNNVLAKIQGKMLDEYPNVSMKSLSPPYKNKFSDSEIDLFITEINRFNPDVVFVGLTAPKQEKLIHLIKEHINNVKMISGIGAVFDFYAGTIRRPSRFWIYLHLEWFIRLLGEPKRLWKRTVISMPKFILDVIKYKARVKKS
ncbi:WecB/TagA/CpsF family glycosyltransferase [Morganella morganii]|uniref:WecB/TagA/CpsF family glycosyltransferase n=1 Tax=Morganella morganii TaxID=582 RepID=UPI000469F4E5|nr:WecB/TagA/CpsF family glycosyltransferase [Morganella morganii]